MVKLLERDGLAFGADTNASTSFDRRIYKLDLPRNDPALLDTALMLMRETASELTLLADAVDARTRRGAGRNAGPQHLRAAQFPWISSSFSYPARASPAAADRHD